MYFCFLFSSVAGYAAKTNMNGAAKAHMSAGTMAAIALGVTGSAGLLIAAIICWRRHKNRQLKPLATDSALYGTINDEDLIS